jgi:hypothetical protein
MTDTGSPWTAEDRELLVSLMSLYHTGNVAEARQIIEAVLDAPITLVRVAELQRAAKVEALAEVKARALDPVQAVIEGPLIGRIKVAGWCDSISNAPPTGPPSEARHRLRADRPRGNQKGTT